MDYFVGDKEYFKGIEKINYEGPKSDNPLAFKFYDKDKIVAGKTMEEQLKFACAYWHSFCANGTDPFGGATMSFPFSDKDPMQEAEKKADAAFEFFTKMGTPYYCFHDADVAPSGKNMDEYAKNYIKITDMFLERQNATGIKLLWNTSNMFSEDTYMNGAASNPDFNVVQKCGFKVKTCLDANIKLSASNYVFWGGREGYMSLINTNMQREKDHIGQFFRMARDYGRSIGFKGYFLIEPKPMEPSKHQYDYDAETAIAFIKEQGLEKDFKCNIEANHATLAGHTFDHDLQVCADKGMLGSVDANQGDNQNGWDTDEFPYDVYETTRAMLVILRNGGLGLGGLNFDAKRRRNSTDMQDLFISHILGMDTFALGLTMADKILKDGKLDAFVANRYSSFDTENGKKFEEGKMSLAELAKFGQTAQTKLISGKQEYLESLVNQYLFG
jgi:xylose isomerase